MKILIAIPCMDTVPTDFMTSMLNLRKTPETSYAVHANSMIYDSRNNFAAKAIQNAYDRVLWLDSDMTFQHDLLLRMTAEMDENGIDYLSALCFKRRMPTTPCVYKKLNYELMDDGTLKSEAITMRDYPKDSLFECAGTGFGAVMTSVRLLKDVWEHYGPPFDPMHQMGEDLSFCWRATECGYKLYCDSRIKTGHIGQTIFSEETYRNQKEAME